jgi:hypothetical protein
MVFTIPKKDLKHNTWYAGACRNSSLAKWDANKQLFYHWRTKFSDRYIEEICHPEDDKIHDVFKPREEYLRPIVQDITLD